MLAIEPPRLGRTYHWLIADLMSRRSGDVNRWTDGSSWPDRWARKLRYKRRDEHYPDVVESIRENGFVRPLDATTHFYNDDDTAGMVRLADGHHRFAAAIDLGYEAVPVLVSERSTVAPDSGDWRAGMPVSRRAGISYRSGSVPSDYSGVRSW
ncbi:ParB-like nuclease domain protein [Microbacterium phage Kieran]|uniref:ParB-like nuclease domain protein n=1 Tax=Microbacterium phage Kieran TaxID=2126931 RepID=A0A2R4A2K6_9CAUD|nr:ParB-like nuclease domain protein [Microbacterium phage Kieran]